MGPHIPGFGKKIQKKRPKVWKSYLEAFYGLLDVRNAENYLELLYSYTHNVFQLLLSFELDPSEASGVDFIESSHQLESMDDYGEVRFRAEI